MSTCSGSITTSRFTAGESPEFLGHSHESGANRGLQRPGSSFERAGKTEIGPLLW